MSSFDGMCALVTGSAPGWVQRRRWHSSAAASEWGRLDILFNNASATKHVANPADLDALSADDFHRLYDVNAIGPFQMICCARLGARLLCSECFIGERPQR